MQFTADLQGGRNGTPLKSKVVLENEANIDNISKVCTEFNLLRNRPNRPLSAPKDRQAIRLQQNQSLASVIALKRTN